MPFPNPASQFKPGQSGNPAGYSRSRRISDALSKLIDEKGADGALATVWLKKALEGNPVFFGMLLDRIEGKVTAPVASEPDEVEDYEVKVGGPQDPGDGDGPATDVPGE